MDDLLRVAIDASRNRSGGAKAHIIGILSASEKAPTGIGEVHIWTYDELALSLPKRSWLYIHTPKVLEKSIVSQIFWQKYVFPKLLKRKKIDVLLSTDAGTVCQYTPNIVMSRDMLSFEKGEMKRYFFSKSWLRLLALQYIQKKSLRNSTEAIFLTEYARNVITQFTGELNNSSIIFHGVSDLFRSEPKEINLDSEIRFIYVSNADKYKHHNYVIEAFDRYSKENTNIRLILVGAGFGSEKDNVIKSIKKSRYAQHKIEITPFVTHDKVSDFLKSNDVFIFASSCENMPNTLVEAMASGMPILCSDRGPMPEILGVEGIYFNPENVDSIYSAMVSIFSNSSKALQVATASFERSKIFSWERCANETFKLILEVGNKNA